MALCLENEALKLRITELSSRESVLVAQSRAVKRLEHQLEDARIVSANWESRVCLCLSLNALVV